MTLNSWTFLMQRACPGGRRDRKRTVYCDFQRSSSSQRYSTAVDAAADNTAIFLTCLSARDRSQLPVRRTLPLFPLRRRRSPSWPRDRASNARRTDGRPDDDLWSNALSFCACRLISITSHEMYVQSICEHWRGRHVDHPTRRHPTHVDTVVIITKHKCLSRRPSNDPSRHSVLH